MPRDTQVAYRVFEECKDFVKSIATLKDGSLHIKVRMELGVEMSDEFNKILATIGDDLDKFNFVHDGLKVWLTDDEASGDDGSSNKDQEDLVYQKMLSCFGDLAKDNADRVINTKGLNVDDTNVLKMPITVPTISGSFKVFYVFERNKDTGKDLLLGLCNAFGLEESEVMVKYKGTASELAHFDGLSAYFDENNTDEFVLWHRIRGGVKRSVMSSITKKASKPEIYREKASESFNALASKSFTCGVLKDAQAVGKFVHDHLNNGFEIFTSAVEHLDEERATNALKLLQSKGKGYGTTELKIEGVCEIVFSGIMKRLKEHQDEITALHESIICSAVSAYTTWTFSKGKFNNTILISMLEKRLENIKDGARGSDDVEMKALAEMLEKTGI